MTTLRIIEQEKLVDNDGDILLPLRRVRDQYLKKAAELKEKAFGDKREGILFASGRYTGYAHILSDMIAEEELDRVVPKDQECDCNKGTFCIVHGEPKTC